MVFLEESGAGSVNALSVEMECPHSVETESTGFCDDPSQIGAEIGTSVCLPRCFQNLNGGVQHNYWHKIVGYEKSHCIYQRGNIIVQVEARVFACCFIGCYCCCCLHSCFSFQSEDSDKSSAESDSEAEVEQVSGYHKLLATLKTSPESESEEEEDESESEEAEESEAEEVDSEGSQEAGGGEGGEEDKNDVPEEEEGSLSFPMLLW